jgi:hypothetical protein
VALVLVIISNFNYVSLLSSYTMHKNKFYVHAMQIRVVPYQVVCTQSMNAYVEVKNLGC